MAFLVDAAAGAFERALRHRRWLKIAIRQHICQLANCQLALAVICHMAIILDMTNQIKKLRKVRNVTLEELAERTGLSTSFLSRMESAKRGLKLENAFRVAKALGVEVDEVSDEFHAEDIAAIERMVVRVGVSGRAVDDGRARGDVALLEIRGGMGPGSTQAIERNEAGEIYPEHIGGFWSFPDVVKAGWRQMSSVYAMPVTGDSMEPTLKAGSYVFIDTTHTSPSPEDIYALDYGDGLVIKRLKLVPRTDRIRVISDNERYGSDELRRDDVRVYGRVVAWFQWRG